ncbi:MAG: dTDP-4-dehydrorhamnose 3,5-epimerase, partial [Gammaproteobacteria bacterium]|nr:dTDP-4-dehydrorhamnose 3,5-epimerase [Gammaproteobacteria bacterium]
KCTDYYHPEDDNCLLWNDEALQIDWPLLNDSPLLSEKDSKGISLSEAPVYP